MTRPKTLMTADDFYLFCCQNDGRYELVDGEVVEMAPVSRMHGRTAINIGAAFHNYCQISGSGWSEVEVGYRVRTGPDTVRGPDVSLVLGEAANLEEDQRGFLLGAPDIAVEIISPSNTVAEIERKVADYLAAGSRRVWVAYPSSRSVVVHRADDTDITYTGDDVITDEELLPGFSLQLPEIFP